MNLDAVNEALVEVMADPFERRQLQLVFEGLADGEKDPEMMGCLLEHADTLFSTANPDIIDALTLAGHPTSLMLRLYGIR